MPFDASTYPYPLRDVARRARAITPSDSVVFDDPIILYVGTTGNLVVKDAYGATVTYQTFPAGSYLPLYVSAVLTATTAGGIVGMS